MAAAPDRPQEADAGGGVIEGESAADEDDGCDDGEAHGEVDDAAGEAYAAEIGYLDWKPDE